MEKPRFHNHLCRSHERRDNIGLEATSKTPVFTKDPRLRNVSIGQFLPVAVTVEEPGSGELLLPLRKGEEDGGEVGDGELLHGGDLQLAEHLHLQVVPDHDPGVGGAGVVPRGESG